MSQPGPDMVLGSASWHLLLSQPKAKVSLVERHNATVRSPSQSGRHLGEDEGCALDAGYWLGVFKVGLTCLAKEGRARGLGKSLLGARDSL